MVKRSEILKPAIVITGRHYKSYNALKRIQKSCNQEDIGTSVVKAPKEKNIILGSFITPEAIAHIMTQNRVSK